MQYQYKVQQYLSVRKEKIVPIPDNCIIDERFLNGVTNIEFIDAFRLLQETFMKIYDDAINDPVSWGYPLENAESIDGCGPTGVRYDRIQDAFYFLFKEGYINDKVLYVNIKNYKDKTKKHTRTGLILKTLCGFGFAISGFDKGATEYTLSFPADMNVIDALDSYVKAVDEMLLPLKKEYRLGPRMDYMGCLFYRFVEDRREQKYDLIFHILTDQVSAEYREMCIALYDYAIAEGKRYHSYYNWCYHSIGFNDWFGLNYNFVTKEVYTNIDFYKLLESDSIDLLYSLPEKLQKGFENPARICRHCGGVAAVAHGNIPTDYNKCRQRFVYDWHGEEKENCTHQFRFNNLRKDDLRYIIDIYKAENN